MAESGKNKPINSRVSEQQAEAEALFTSIGDGAISTDKYGKITRVNPVAQSLLGLQEKNLIGEWFPKAIPALHTDGTPVNMIDRPITQAFLTGRSISEKMWYRHADGRVIPVAVTVSPIVLHGQPVGAIEVFRDITLQEEVDRMKSEFISLASHQLRTPLSAIKTYSHMLVDGYMGEINEAQKKSLKTILGASNRMNELISTLLNITRMESGTITVTPKSLRVDHLAEEVIKELSLMAADKQIALTVTLAGKGSPLVKTDQLILKEVLSNLLANGIKYTPEGGSVAVKIQPRAHDVLVMVIDTGWGIPLEDQEQIFTKFFRAANTVKRETTGTGLGLYLVKGLLDTLGGTIDFRSEEGKGTEFFFTIPKGDPKRRTARLTPEPR